MEIKINGGGNGG